MLPTSDHTVKPVSSIQYPVKPREIDKTQNTGADRFRPTQIERKVIMDIWDPEIQRAATGDAIADSGACDVDGASGGAPTPKRRRPQDAGPSFSADRGAAVHGLGETAGGCGGGGDCGSGGGSASGGEDTQQVAC